MNHETPLIARCKFKTKRLSIESLDKFISTPEESSVLAKSVMKILTPKVVEMLPEHWHAIETQQKALDWIRHQRDEGVIYPILFKENNEVVGFLFLHEVGNSTELRIGYLLSEAYWKQGIGSELIKGFVEWCIMDGKITLISGGVDRQNIASRRILEKNGFYMNKSSQDVIEMIRKIKS